MMRRLVLAAMVVVFAAVGSAGVLGQSATPLESAEDLAESVGQSSFPSAEEVSVLFGIELEASGISDDLSQLWEGIDFDHQQDVPSAQMQIYRTPEETPPDQMYGAIVDIVHFESVEDGMRHVDEVMFTDYPAGFETDLGGDYVVTQAFSSDDGFGGAFIFLRDGPVAVAVTTLASDGSETESLTEAIAELVLSRLERNG